MLYMEVSNQDDVMKKRNKIILISLISITLTASFIGWVKKLKPVSVIVAKVEQGDVQRTVTNTRAAKLNPVEALRSE